ncbi:MAG TPA: GxxExxY protein [Candidatus Moranbacteria bacterium]|nr:GxxExxY protein [Candidatus Moranbacteria bacterium]HBT45273.1 GxxExxY protein [Candidatus Moranbacteria bacterium]
MTNKLLEEELSYKVRGCFYGVANKYGKGLKESIYQKALEEEFEKVGVDFQGQKRIDIFSVETGKKLGTYVPDFVVGDKIIVEIKATDFTRIGDMNQQRSYLKASKYEISYLVNFGTKELEIKRSICTNDRKSFITKLEINSQSVIREYP